MGKINPALGGVGSGLSLFSSFFYYPTDHINYRFLTNANYRLISALMNENIIEKAVQEAGGSKIVASECGLRSQQAVMKWMRAGKLPRTEWTGETNYSAVIERLTKKKFTKAMLLSQRAAALPEDRRTTERRHA